MGRSQLCETGLGSKATLGFRAVETCGVIECPYKSLVLVSSVLKGGEIGKFKGNN